MPWQKGVAEAPRSEVKVTSDSLASRTGARTGRDQLEDVLVRTAYFSARVPEDALQSVVPASPPQASWRLRYRER